MFWVPSPAICALAGRTAAQSMSRKWIIAAWFSFEWTAPVWLSPGCRRLSHLANGNAGRARSPLRAAVRPAHDIFEFHFPPVSSMFSPSRMKVIPHAGGGPGRLWTRRHFLARNAMGIGSVALAWLLREEKLLATLPNMP